MLNPAEYATAPLLSLDGSVTLAETLAKGAKDAEDPGIRKAGRTLTKRAAAAKDAQASQQKAVGDTALSAPNKTPQEVDIQTDRTWRAAHMRLEAWTLLPPSKKEKAARAAALLTTMFGDSGLTMLQLPYPEQRNRMNVLIQRIDDEGLADELTDLIGADFVECMRSETAAYDKMVSWSLSLTNPDKELLVPHLRALNDMIVRFASVVIGSVDLDEDGSEEAEKAAHALLAPIRNARAKVNEAAAETRASNKEKKAKVQVEAKQPE